MAMASNTNDKNKIIKEFSLTNNLMKRIQKKYKNITVLSIGMSNDYLLAIENGSNMIRVGSSIFGKRK